METQGTSPTWLRQVATALSSRYNVSIREGKGWAMNVDKKVLIYNAEHLLALDRDTCLGILLHELGHLHFTKLGFTETKKFQEDPLNKILFDSLNAYEDVRVNEKMSQSYQGSRDLIDAMNELLAGDGVKELLKMSKQIKDGKQQRANFNMPEYSEVFYISMCKLLGNLFPSFMPEAYYDPHKLELINEIVAEAETRDLRNHATTQEVFDFVEEVVMPRVQEYLPKPTPQGGEEGGNEEGGRPASNDSPDTGEKGEGEDKSDGGDTSSDTGDSQDGENSTQKGTGDGGNSSDKPKPKPEPKQKKKAPPQRGGDGSSIDEWKRDLEEKVKKAIKRGKVNPDDQHKTEPFSTYGSDLHQSVRKICNVDEHMQDSETLQRRFSNKFETLFRNNQYKRETPNQRSGRLDKHSLHKFATGRTRLFKRKLDTNKKSYAVAFLMDLSGSMYEEQIRGSFHAMLAFTTTLQRLMIPYGIGFFSHRSTVGKHFANKKITNRKLSLSASAVLDGGTKPDELLIGLCGKELATQPVKEKIVVILTDGLWMSHSYEELRKLKKSNPDFHIYIVGLGLGEQHVEHIEPEIDGVATLLISNDADGIVERYIEIAKKHLL